MGRTGERRLRVAVVGCGHHANRSVLPSLAYLPVELVATCDTDAGRARAAADRFGAKAVCGGLKEVAALGLVEAVLLVVGPHAHPELACEAVGLGLDVWMEKPPAADVAGVEQAIAARNAARRRVAVGFKKMFMPGMTKLKSLLDTGQFGRLRTVTARFPLDVPPDGAKVLAERRATNWLNNGVHPLSALVLLGGRPDALTVHRSAHGGGFVTVEFPGGAVGSLHLAEGHAMSGPMERYEAVGERGHLVLENDVRLTVHRPGYPFDYAHGLDFAAGSADVAALVYEPQHSLSVLENKAEVLQGFVPELRHFAGACLDGTAVTRGTLEQARAVMECYEAALLSGGAPVRLDDLRAARARG